MNITDVRGCPCGRGDYGICPQHTMINRPWFVRVNEVRRDDGTSAGMFGDGINRVLVRLPDGRETWMLARDLREILLEGEPR